MEMIKFLSAFLLAFDFKLFKLLNCGPQPAAAAAAAAAAVRNFLEMQNL
jgi:hypothetical protein